MTRPFQRPSLSPGEFRDDRRERPHPLTVERLLQQPPLLYMLLAV
jgi:hypothetical protein